MSADSTDPAHERTASVVRRAWDHGEAVFEVVEVVVVVDDADKDKPRR